MNMPEFTAEATLHRSSKHYWNSMRPASNKGVIAQSRMTCAFKAGRLAGRCLSHGFDHQDCMEAAVDFNNFCNEHDL